MNVAIIGSNGFLGSELTHAAKKVSTCKIYSVTRSSFIDFVNEKSLEIDIVINSAMPSARFWAENNPALDFKETVKKTRDLLDLFPNSKIIQISSISAKTQLHKVYGRHKKAAECLLDRESNLIFRLGPLYGRNLKKGVIIDLIKNNDVFISEDSKYAFTNISWVAKKILENLDLTGLIEFGANGFVEIKDLREALSSSSNCVGAKDDQVFDDYFQDTPSSNDVIDFSLQLKKRNLG